MDQSKSEIKNKDLDKMLKMEQLRYYKHMNFIFSRIDVISFCEKYIDFLEKLLNDHINDYIVDKETNKLIIEIKEKAQKNETR